MKKLKFFGVVAISMVLAVLITSCGEETKSTKPSSDATLKSFTINGEEMPFGAPGTVSGAELKELTINEETAINGVMVGITANSKKAKVEFGIRNNIGQVIPKDISAPIEFDNNNILVIKITAENGVFLHYRFLVKIEVGAVGDVNAQLKSLRVAGREEPLADPAVSVSEAEARNLQVSVEEAAVGVFIRFETISNTAVAKYGITASSSAAPASWANSDTTTSPLNGGDFLIIMVTADNTSLYYKYIIDVKTVVNRDSNADLSSVVINGAQVDMAAPAGSINAALATVIPLSKATADNGVTVVFTRSSANSTARWTRITSTTDPDRLTWRESGNPSPVPVQNGDLLVIRVIAEDNTTQFYKYRIDVEMPLAETVQSGDKDTLAGGLLILQAYGSAVDASGVSHSFVELFNNTSSAVNLDGITLYYANGTSVAADELPNQNTEDERWNLVQLSGALPSKTSYLILGSRQSHDANYQMQDNSGDVNETNFRLSSRAFKVALIRNDKVLTAQNPFNMGAGATAAGYIDMLGSAANYSSDGNNRDRLFGFEEVPAVSSEAVAARRNSLTDTDNNRNDFAQINYRSIDITRKEVSSDFQVSRPKNIAHGAWDPFPKDTNANLQSFTFGGKSITLSNPAASITAAAPSTITMNEAEAAGGTIVIIPSSEKASANFAVMTALSGTPSWMNSGNNSGRIHNGNFIVIRITAENSSVQYYVYSVTISIDNQEIQPGVQDSLASKLLILQAYGSSDTAEGVSHSFVELYNASDASIHLTGISLYYADGIRGVGITADTPWKSIALAGDLPSGCSFLILGAHQGSTIARLDIQAKHGANYGDINDASFTLGNRSFKVAIIRSNNKKLSAPNPFNIGGQTAAGYIDMLGSANNRTSADPDNIFGFETAPARNSGSEAPRRKSLYDTNNNSVDFIAARYGATGDSMSNAELEVRRPRNMKSGKWDPFALPAVEQPQPGSNKLLIFNVGTNHPTNADSTTHSFIELYNAGDTAVNLSGYSIQIAAANGGAWNTKINLNGTIQAGRSFLIRGKQRAGGHVQIPTGESGFDLTNSVTGLEIDNRGAKIALLSNTNTLTVDNPFNIDGNGTKAAGYVDMVGAINEEGRDSISGFETQYVVGLSGSRILRRTSLNDTDNNKNDFESVDFRPTANPVVSQEQIEIKKPKNSAYGVWDPFPAAPAVLNSLTVANVAATLGTPADTYDTVTNPGAVSISSLLAANAVIAPNISAGASYRAAKVTGSGAPAWLPSDSFSFASGDNLYIEVTASDSRTRKVYKIVVTVVQASNDVTISGTYNISTTSEFPQTKVVIEAYSNSSAQTLISSTDANVSNKTWSLKVLRSQPVWFKIVVTDSTGYSFGRVLDSQTYANDTQNVVLTMGPFTAPQMTAFTVLNATSSDDSSTLVNKTGSINQTTGVISFSDTQFKNVSSSRIINFHQLRANFTISSGARLMVGNVQQVSGTSGTQNNYYKEVVFTVIGEDNARKTYRVPAPTGFTGSTSVAGSYRVVGTRSWQTMGFGVMNINTQNTSVGIPWVSPTSAHSKLNNVWNTTGTYTYYGPEGRVVTGGTDIRYRGNGTMRNDVYKSYNLKLHTAAAFDYYNYKTDKFETLPEHTRWVLLAHPKDSTRIRGSMGWEMGRHVLDNMGWQPHSDWVVLFVNGEYKGVYILVETIRPDAARLNVNPQASNANHNGGFIVELNNLYWVFDEGYSTSNPRFLFDEMYSYMTSHRNNVATLVGGNWTGVSQGTVFSFQNPDSDLGWYYPDPPPGTGNLNWWSNTNFPLRGIALAGTLPYGGDYNRKSNPVAQWIVSDGTPSYSLQSFSYGTQLSTAYPNYQQSAFVAMSKKIQDAEDSIYAREWDSNGVGGYHQYIDYKSFIDWQIIMELTMNWEVLILNGQYMHFDPKAGSDGKGRIKMGPIWDLDQGWSNRYRTINVGDIRKSPFWIKELIGWNFYGAIPGQSVSGATGGWRDPFYVSELKARWNAVNSKLQTEVDDYVELLDKRFGRLYSLYTNTNELNVSIHTGNVTNSSAESEYSYQGSGGARGIRINGNRAELKENVRQNRSALNSIINGY